MIHFRSAPTTLHAKIRETPFGFEFVSALSCGSNMDCANLHPISHTQGWVKYSYCNFAARLDRRNINPILVVETGLGRHDMSETLLWVGTTSLVLYLQASILESRWVDNAASLFHVHKSEEMAHLGHGATAATSIGSTPIRRSRGAVIRPRCSHDADTQFRLWRGQGEEEC